MGIKSDLAVWDGDTETRESNTLSAGRFHRTSGGAAGEWDKSHCNSHRKVAPEVAQNLTLETELLKQENGFLRRRVEELEADRADWKTERSKLQSIIERQTIALPPAEKAPGIFSRLLGGLR